MEASATTAFHLHVFLYLHLFYPGCEGNIIFIPSTLMLLFIVALACLFNHYQLIFKLNNKKSKPS